MFSFRIKENEETTVLAIKEPETVTEFPALDEDIFTKSVQLDKSKQFDTPHVYHRISSTFSIISYFSLH